MVLHRTAISSSFSAGMNCSQCSVFTSRTVWRGQARQGRSGRRATARIGGERGSLRYEKYYIENFSALDINRYQQHNT